MSEEFSIEDEIKDVKMGPPHVVILGAGASLAAFPNGDKFRRTLPLMNNLIDVLDIKHVLKEHNIFTEGKNFEEVYSELFAENKHQSLLSEIEGYIYKYFYELEIPDNPTVYDHLVLSLRNKDLIATFNWDPLLIQAYIRNQKQFSLPRLVFLHGNVAIGYCKRDRIKGLNGSTCKECKQPFTHSTLLYPVKQKDYRNDHFISLEWTELEKCVRRAYMLTLFGYSAPKSDYEAINIMESEWGMKSLAEVEIIDIKDKKELEKTWNGFIFDTHYEAYDDFYESFIARHPRRTCEALRNQTQGCEWLGDNNILKNSDFDKLWAWLAPLKKAEDNNR